jgi:hypothetical protein
VQGLSDFLKGKLPRQRKEPGCIAKLHCTSQVQSVSNGSDKYVSSSAISCISGLDKN